VRPGRIWRKSSRLSVWRLRRGTLWLSLNVNAKNILRYFQINHESRPWLRLRSLSWSWNKIQFLDINSCLNQRLSAKTSKVLAARESLPELHTAEARPTTKLLGYPPRHRNQQNGGLRPGLQRGSAPLTYLAQTSHQPGSITCQNLSTSWRGHPRGNKRFNGADHA
jgi:hypothetical protein